MKKILFLLVALALVGAACGNDDDSGGDGGASGEGDLAAFCERYIELDETTGLGGEELADPGQLEDVVNLIIDESQPLIETAPPEIRGDLQQLSDAFEQLRDELSEVDFDITQLSEDSEALAFVAGPEFEALDVRLDEFTAANCNGEGEDASDDAEAEDGDAGSDDGETAAEGDEPTEAPTEDAGSSSEDEPVETFSGDPNSEFCQVGQEIDPEDLADTSVVFDPAALEALAADLTANIELARGVVPSEIADDFNTLADSVAVLVAELARVGYDLTQVDPDALASLDDPAILAASQRIDAYVSQVCLINVDDEPDEAEGDDGAESVPAPDDIEPLLEQGFIDAGFTPEEASCLVQRLDLQDLASGEATPDLIDAFTECGIDLERFGG